MAISNQSKTFVKILSLADPKHILNILSSFYILIENLYRGSKMAISSQPKTLVKSLAYGRYCWVFVVWLTIFKGGVKWLPMAVSSQPKTLVKSLAYLIQSTHGSYCRVSVVWLKGPFRWCLSHVPFLYLSINKSNKQTLVVTWQGQRKACLTQLKLTYQGTNRGCKKLKKKCYILFHKLTSKAIKMVTNW